MTLAYLLAIYFGLKYITIPDRAVDVIHVAMLSIVTFFVLRILNSIIGYLFKQGLARNEKTELGEKKAKGIQLIVQIIVGSVGILFLIDNLGFYITTPVAGLSIGGIAIAQAVQLVLRSFLNNVSQPELYRA